MSIRSSVRSASGKCLSAWSVLARASAISDARTTGNGSATDVAVTAAGVVAHRLDSQDPIGRPPTSMPAATASAPAAAAIQLARRAVGGIGSAARLDRTGTRVWKLIDARHTPAKTMQTIQEDMGSVAPPLDRPAQKVAGLLDLAGVVRRDARVKELLRFALTLGERAARPLDVRASAIVIALQKNHARPDANGAFVLAGEIVIESREQQLFDAGLAVGVTRRKGRFGRLGIGHRVSKRLSA